MASALVLGEGRTLVWQNKDFCLLPYDIGIGIPILAVELEMGVDINELLSNKKALPVGLLIKTNEFKAATTIMQKAGKSARVTAYGVLTGYYTSHIPIGTKGEKITIRYCLGLTRTAGWSAAKQFVKIFMTFLGLGSLLYDYFLVYIEKNDCNC